MIPRSPRAVIALGALALTHSALAIDFAQPDFTPLQCDAGESCGFTDAAVQARSAPSETVIGAAVEDLAIERQRVFEWLAASRAPVDGAAFKIELTRQDLLDIGEASAGGLMLRPDPRRYQVGVDKAVGVDLDFEGLHRKRLAGEHMGGAVTSGLDGELVWTARAHSAGATALRIGIEAFDLPAGAALYAYSDRGEAFGPYTKRGPSDTGVFWTNTIMGDTVNLQLHYSGPRNPETLAALGFRVASISHIGSRFPLADFVGAKGPAEKAFCSYNESCVEPGRAFQGAQSAVALILFSSQGGTFLCSGGLLADTDGSSVIPYFLTANHCVSKGREANSVEAVFDFTGSCNDRYGQGNYPRTNGSSIKASNRTSDYTLLELSQTPPGNRTYLGWNSSPVANSNGVGLFRLSHPSGAPQAYSEHSVDTSKPTCGSWPRGDWIYSRDTLGATEGGSSGSPVMNSSGQVVGQLSGACGFNVGDVCDADSNATVDGAFAAYFDAVKPFLDPGNGGGGGCTLLPKGASCTADSECCSGSCKGKPGSKTCK